MYGERERNHRETGNKTYMCDAAHRGGTFILIHDLLLTVM
jgi:hypothetical protein